MSSGSKEYLSKDGSHCLVDVSLQEKEQDLERMGAQCSESDDLLENKVDRLIREASGIKLLADGDSHKTLFLPQNLISLEHMESRVKNARKLCRMTPQNIHNPSDIITPTASVVISGIKITALVDSGSDCNIMKLSIATALNLTPTGSRTRIGLASNGCEMESVGSVTTAMNISGIDYSLELLVVDNLDGDLILGTDFMKLHKRVTLKFKCKGDPLTVRPYNRFTMTCLRCRFLQEILFEKYPISWCFVCHSDQYLQHHFEMEKPDRLDMIVPVDIKDSMFTALLDSGATSCLIKLSVAKMLNLNIFGPPSAIGLAAENCVATVVGRVAVTITLNSRDYDLVFGVVAGLHDELILGVDFLRLHQKVHFDMGGEGRPITVPCNKEFSISDPVRVFRELRRFISPRPMQRFLTTLLSPFAAMLVDAQDIFLRSEMIKYVKTMTRSPSPNWHCNNSIP